MSYYMVFFILAVLMAVIYVFLWNRHFDVNMSVIFLLIPIINLGYCFQMMGRDAGTVVVGLKISYLGGCFLPYFMLMCVLNVCDINVKNLYKTFAFIWCCTLFLSVLTIGHTEIFYNVLGYEDRGNKLHILREYGPMHTAVYISIIAFFAVGLVAIIYSLFKNREVSRTTIVFLMLPEVVCFFSFFNFTIADRDYELVPVTYVLAEVTYLIIIHRITLYSVSDMLVETMVETGDTGFIMMDFKSKYLGSNETAKSIIPELYNIRIDEKFKGNEVFNKTVNLWVGTFVRDNLSNKIVYIKHNDGIAENDEAYIINVNYLYDGKKRRGYQILLMDDTQNQKYIRLLDNYNVQLESEVEEKTRHLTEMHDNLVLGLASMVESRDNSTGGHIRRTSKVVELLIEQIKKDNVFGLDDKFCTDIVKAAPLHDVGKIAVDDAVLKKPGSFTKEEFEAMKSHTSEGAKVLKEILKDTEDEMFKKVAINVAHYHHERWDGTGYPDGLKGEEIPIEARIMAVADVYDAVVSKRVYKEKMSYDAANSLILEEMGTHFDIRLKPYYEKARPEIEAYYASLKDNLS
ncbi:MAG: HD domain-containing protein [Lachnospiraceae bacterium]|nr:HD domain-containing protein [Lachnospiraceae bacterium]